ncbi:MAG TPA: nicotinamide riboside transporter PnuC [Williamwhitmania sp.]|nr:nicotinamide riboside transporter PnuC [Williamwhitmania sp.]
MEYLYLAYNWAIGHYVELLGTISGLVYLYLEIKERVWLWPVGLATSALYVVVFYTSKFYADMALNIYYVLISFYGWYQWLFGGTSAKHKNVPLRIQPTPTRLWPWLAAAFAVFFFLLWWILKDFTDSPVPLGDAFTTALSIVATWMLTKKYVEQWWLWVIVNAVSMSLYVWKGLYPTSVLFFFYTTLAVVGYYKWKQTMMEEGNEK